MPLTGKGEEILKNMQKQYGADKGKSVFYASKNKGTITGVESLQRPKSHRQAMESFAKNLKKRTKK
jgi:hypothetical protein